MAYQSYYLFCPSGPNGALFSDDLKASSISALGPNNKHRAMLAIFNPKGSNKNIHIGRINIQNSTLNSNSNTTSTIRFDLLKGTTTPDGTDISSAAFMLDSNDSIPSSIKFYYRSSSNSISSGFSTISKIIVNPNLTKTGAFMYYGWGGGLNISTKTGNSAIYGINSSSEVQQITLNQNETLSIVPNNIGNSYLMTINLFFSIAGKMGIVSVESTGLEGIPTLSINNTSATDTLKLISLTIDNYALDTIPYYTLERIDGISSQEDNDTIESLEPTPFDTNYPWPNNLLCKKNATVISGGSKYGGLGFTQVNASTTFGSSGALYRSISPYPWGITQTLSGGIIGGLLDNMDISYGGVSDKNRKSNIILKEGEGIGIFNRGSYNAAQGPSARAPFAISIKIDVYSKEKIYFGV